MMVTCPSPTDSPVGRSVPSSTCLRRISKGVRVRSVDGPGLWLGLSSERQQGLLEPPGPPQPDPLCGKLPPSGWCPGEVCTASSRISAICTWPLAAGKWCMSKARHLPPQVPRGIDHGPGSKSLSLYDGFTFIDIMTLQLLVAIAASGKQGSGMVACQNQHQLIGMQSQTARAIKSRDSTRDLQEGLGLLSTRLDICPREHAGGLHFADCKSGAAAWLDGCTMNFASTTKALTKYMLKCCKIPK